MAFHPSQPFAADHGACPVPDAPKPKPKYMQVYDEAQEKWVLRKVDMVPVVPNPGRVIRRNDPMPNMETICLNCHRTLGSNHRFRNEHVTCYGTDTLFMY